MTFSVLRYEEALEVWKFIRRKTNIPLPPPSASPSSKDHFYPWRSGIIAGINASLTHTILSKSQKLLFHVVLHRGKVIISFSHFPLEYSHNCLLKIICASFLGNKNAQSSCWHSHYSLAVLFRQTESWVETPKHRHYPNSTAWNKKCRERRVKNMHWNSLSPTCSREQGTGGAQQDKNREVSFKYFLSYKIWNMSNHLF